MFLWWVGVGAIAQQPFWLTFVWFAQWWMKGALCLLPYFRRIFPFWLAVFVHFGVCLMHDLQVASQQLQTLPRAENGRALYFLNMLGERGDDHTSDPSCFNPSHDRTTTVSLGVKLCSATFMAWWQTRVSSRTCRLLHQAGLNFQQHASLRRRLKPSHSQYWQEHMLDRDYLIQLSRRRLLWRNEPGLRRTVAF